MKYRINSIVPFAGRSRSRVNRAAMNPWLMGLGGLGLGAGLMFMFDPVQGRRRRALARDQLAHAARLLTYATGVTARDLGHRAYGLLAEVDNFFRRKEVSDEALTARVRARIGRSVSHPHAISVTAHDGHVRLSGPVLAHEVDRLLSGVLSTPGVKEVEDALTVHTHSDDVPALQGGRPRTGDCFALMRTNWPPTARLLAGLAGGALMANCLARRDPVSVALGAMGFGLFIRSATNLEMKTLLGVGRDRQPIRAQKTININAPVEKVFGFWTDYRNFPRFMSKVRQARPTSNGRSHWIVSGPAGLPVEWTAEVTELIPNKLLAWRSVPGSAIRNNGVIHFESNHGGDTRVHIQLCYYPPGGAIGHALAKLFGSDPKSEMDEDLLRMKTFIESGRPPHDAANPSPARREIMFARAGTTEAPARRQARLAGGP